MLRSISGLQMVIAMVMLLTPVTTKPELCVLSTEINKNLIFNILLKEAGRVYHYATYDWLNAPRSRISTGDGLNVDDVQEFELLTEQREKSWSGEEKSREKRQTEYS